MNPQQPNENFWLKPGIRVLCTERDHNNYDCIGTVTAVRKSDDGKWEADVEYGRGITNTMSASYIEEVEPKINAVKPKINAVFEGGGVRAIAHVGAIQATEKKLGISAPDLYGNLAGTSGGAVIASLLACGYDGAGLEKVMRAVDYRRFEDRDWLQDFPLVGAELGLVFEEGMHKGNFLLRWMQDCFAHKMHPGQSQYTFGDLEKEYGKNRLQIIASDITRGQKLVLPRDIEDYEGYSRDTLPVALAVRMSASIPFFFRPIKLKSRLDGNICFIVDGGLLSDYPLDLVNNDHECTLGYRLVSLNSGKRNDIHGVVTMLSALFNTMLTGNDNFYIDENKFRNTIAIETFRTDANGKITETVDSTDFGLGTEQLNLLYNNGITAAEKFLDQAGAALCGPVQKLSLGYSRHQQLGSVKLVQPD